MSPPHWRSRRGIFFCCPHWPVNPPIALPPRFLRASWRRRQRVVAPFPLPPGHPVLLRLPVRLFAASDAPLLAVGFPFPLAGPAALPPVSYTAYLVFVDPVTAPQLHCCPFPCGRPPSCVCCAALPSPSVTVPASLSRSSPPLLPRAPAAARPSPRAPAPGPGHQYCP